MIEMLIVESSNVKAVGYDEEISTLYIQFKNNSLYAYTGVEPAKFNSLLEAESVGKFLNKEIKKVYESTQIWDDDPKYKEIIVE